MGHRFVETVQLIRARAPRVAVLGDLLLDGWWLGRVERIAREAPAPVVEVVSRSYAPGGAGNTARNLAALGASVRLVGVVGDDEPGRQVRGLLVAAGVDTSGVVGTAEVQTVAKNRVVVDDHVLLRVDDSPRIELHHLVELELAERTAAAIADAEAVVVCDYGQHRWLNSLQAAFGAVGRPPLVVVDAHDPARWAKLRPDIVTPNAAEAFRLLDRVPRPDEVRADLVVASARQLRKRTGAETVVVTLDRDGTVVLTTDRAPYKTSARPRPEYNAAGAGDTYVAALTAAVAAGCPLTVAAELAQAAADVVVQRPGTSVCTAADLIDQLNQGDPVLSEPELVRRVEADKAAGRRVVFTNGCFDVLHRGHTTYLEQAAQLGDILVVAVNDDDSVRRLKGPDRPINSAADRVGVLSALGCVTYVTIFSTDTPIPLLRRLRPQVYVKGGDYNPDMLAETSVVEGYGGEVRVMGYLPSASTTEIVARIRAAGSTAADLDAR